MHCYHRRFLAWNRPNALVQCQVLHRKPFDFGMLAVMTFVGIHWIFVAALEDRKRTMVLLRVSNRKSRHSHVKKSQIARIKINNNRELEEISMVYVRSKSERSGSALSIEHPIAIGGRVHRARTVPWVLGAASLLST